MTSLKDFLQSVVENLQQAGIDYVICGSIAASFYGVERSTQDTDIIINPNEEQLTNFLRLLGDAFYVSSSEQQFRDALCVAIIQYDHLDRDYLYKWAKELKVESSLERLLKQAKEQLNSG